MATAVHVTTCFLPIKMTFNDSSVKTGDVCISDVQLEDNALNYALPLPPHFSPTLHFKKKNVLYSSLYCVWSSQCVWKHLTSTVHVFSKRFFCFRHFSSISIIFPEYLVMRSLHCVVLECLWNSWWTTEKYRWKSKEILNPPPSIVPVTILVNVCPNPYGERK